MTPVKPIEKLCELLDENDEYYESFGNRVWWGRPIDAKTGNPINVFHNIAEPAGGDRLRVELQLATPEQAVAATVGAEVNGDTSDGYHTFNELYHHRAVLFSVIVANHRGIAWKSRRHHDGTMYDGMFIVGIDTPDGQATYHYDIDPYWDMFDCEELDRAPEWDGHTPDDAIERIGKLATGDEVYTREDVEGAFVSGYSLGSLPVGSDLQWDENRQTVDEHMSELGWVRKDAATLGTGTCEMHDCEGSFSAVNRPVWRCDCGAFMTQYTDATTYHKPRFCPNCGRRVVSD